MATKRTSRILAPPTAPLQPVQSYGCKILGKDQFFYDRFAFCWRTPIDFGAPRRIDLFKRIADKINPSYFEWHPWTERLVEAVSENKYVAFAGASGCVAGHTRILDPITGAEPTIRELCENRIAPMVMTLNGPERAEVPFVKGIADIFELRLDNGATLYATGEHRVLSSHANATKWSRVDSLKIGQHLLSYAPAHLSTTSARALSVRELNALGSQKTVGGSRGHCFSYCHLDDALLPMEVDTCQSSFPLPDGAPAHNRRYCGAGDLALEDRYSPRRLCVAHPSMTDSIARRSSFCTPSLHRYGPGTGAPLFPLFPHSLRSHLGGRVCFPFLELDPGFSRTHSACEDDSVLVSPDFHRFGYVVSQSKIHSIRRTGKETFYDITVPIAHHYFAEGTLSHNSAKTHNIVGFACTWWLCNPEQSSVIFCSTTAKALRKRGWANVQKFYTTIPGPRLGHMLNSEMTWQATNGDHKHAITGIAVEEGDTIRVSDNIKGVHTVRQMVIIDEATAVPPAIFDACTNLYSYPEEFIMVMLGNPRSRLDEFGKFIEPMRGWQSVTVDDEEWETTPKIDGTPGVCIRFDAEKSPNITLGQIVSRHLPTKERVEARKRMAGSENDPTYWSNERGFPPPEGLNKNVFSESQLEIHRAYDKHTFTGTNFMIVGGLDPARTGGDKAMLRFAKLGEIRRDVFGIELGPPVQVKLNAKSSNPIDYQITEQVERECAKVMCFGPGSNGSGYVCTPEHFGVDATGGGADLCDIMQRHWSLKVMRIGFGESPSDAPCSHEDRRPASEVWKNKRAEMYFRSSNAVKSGQLKGVDKDTAKELVTIEFDDRHGKIVLMSKDDYRKKFGKSPDASDSLVIIVEVARRLGFKLAATGLTVNRDIEFSQEVAKTQDVFASVNYAPEEELGEYESTYASAYEEAHS